MEYIKNLIRFYAGLAIVLVVSITAIIDESLFLLFKLLKSEFSTMPIICVIGMIACVVLIFMITICSCATVLELVNYIRVYKEVARAYVEDGTFDELSDIQYMLDRTYVDFDNEESFSFITIENDFLVDCYEQDVLKIENTSNASE